MRQKTTVFPTGEFAAEDGGASKAEPASAALIAVANSFGVHEGWTNLVGKYYPNAAVEFHAEHEKMLETAKQFKDPHRWSGKSVKDLAMEEDTFDLDVNGNPFKWDYDYEVIYKWTSHFVHGTVIALDEHAAGPGTAFQLMGGRQNIDKGGMALFNVSFVSAQKPDSGISRYRLRS